MEQAAQRFEQYTGRPLDTLDLRCVLQFEEHHSASRYLADMFDVDVKWLV